MKYQFKNNYLIKLAYLIIIANATLPAFDYFCPFYVTMIPIVIVLYDCVRLFLDSIIKAIITLVIGLFLYIVFINIISFNINDVSDYLTIWLPCLIAIRLRRTNDKQNALFVLRVMIIFTTITCITSLIGYSVNPFASRDLASSVNYDFYMKSNVAGYNHIYAFIMVISIDFFLARNEKKKIVKLLYFLDVVLTLLCIYQSQYTLAVIITFFALLALLININRKKSIIFLGLLATILIFFKNIIANVIKYLSLLVNYEYVKDRLLQLAMLIQTGETFQNDIVSGDRFEKYTDCLEHFFSQPIGGSIFSGEPIFVTGHTAILDVMSAAGIIGLIFYVGFFYIMSRIIIGKFNLFKNKYAMVIILSFIAISLFNPNHQALMMFIVFVGTTCINVIDKRTNVITIKNELNNNRNQICKGVKING